MLAIFHQGPAVFRGTIHRTETLQQRAPARNTEMKMIPQGTGVHPRLAVEFRHEQGGINQPIETVIAHK